MRDPAGQDLRAGRGVGLLLGLLAAGMAAVSLLGPLGTGVMRYRTSETTLNQLLGSDLAALGLVAPLALAAAWLGRHGRPAGWYLATGVAAYALYTYFQVVVGQEYLRLPGNVERFFPLLLAVFVLAEAVFVLAWRRLPAEAPEMPRRLRTVLGWLLLAVAAFLLLGLHLRTLLVAWTDPGALTEYASSPTPFWLVKLMDLGIVVPVAVAVGIGLLRGARWALRAAYPLLTGYTLLAWSVASMAAVMWVRQDPDSSVVLVAAFGGFAVAFTAVAVAAYRAL